MTVQRNHDALRAREITAQAQPTRLTVEEVAAELRMSPNTVRYWRSRGIGPRAYKIGRRVFIDRADLEAWLEDQKNGSTVA